MNYKAADDLLELINRYFKEKTLYLAKREANTLSIVKSIENVKEIDIKEGDTRELKDAYWQGIYYGGREPLIIRDTHSHPVASKLVAKNNDNIRSYVGVPVFYKNGEMFGTLCAVDAKPTNFTTEDVETIQRFSNLFSYVVELEKKANYDILTGLFSPCYLYDNFDTFPENGMLMSIDLDGFKQVNDQYGHEAGDIVLKEVGRRIRGCLGKNDIGVRLGGDEFILYFRNFTDRIDMEKKGRQILTALSEWESFEYDIEVSASIGIVQIPEDGEKLETLLKKADQAMYWTKKNGKHFYSFYTK